MMTLFVRWMILSLLIFTGCALNNTPPSTDHSLNPSNAQSKVSANVRDAFNLTLLGEADVGRYEMLEFQLETAFEVVNPFDPTAVDLTLHLVSPTGEKREVSAFWYQAFKPSSLIKVDAPVWRVRFTPTEIGLWTAQAKSERLGLKSNPISFTVLPSESHGFVYLHPANPRYFAFEDGTPFIPIGVNMAWWHSDPLGDYESWLDQFAANGGNTIRVWMASWAFGIEWQDTPLGDYGPRLKQAWLLDQLFRMAAERGVYIILVLNNHGQFSDKVDPEWTRNPYNAALGGPLKRPEEFVTNPEARAFFKRRLTYIVNRWSHAPNLLMWEWWNEFNHTAISQAAMADWVTTMTAHLAESDPYHHLTTISGAEPDSEIWRLPGLDVVSHHEYSTIDPLLAAPLIYQHYAASVPDKPILLAEFAYAAPRLENIDSPDQLGSHLHNGLWAAPFSGYTGTGMYWWWNHYIDPLQLWGHFRGIATFIAAEDLALYEPVPLILEQSKPDSPQAFGLGLRHDDRYLVWLRQEAYTSEAIRAADYQAKIDMIKAKKPLAEVEITFSEVEGLTLTLNNMRPGNYLVRWFDPQTGTWLPEGQGRVEGDVLLLVVPSFQQDIAVKIEPLDN